MERVCALRCFSHSFATLPACAFSPLPHMLTAVQQKLHVASTRQKKAPPMCTPNRVPRKAWHSARGHRQFSDIGAVVPRCLVIRQLLTLLTSKHAKEAPEKPGEKHMVFWIHGVPTAQPKIMVTACSMQCTHLFELCKKNVWGADLDG